MAVTTLQQAPDLFQTYVAQNMRYALSRVQALDEALPDDEERELLMHALTFGLASPAAWSQTRQTLLLLAPKMEQAGYRGEWVSLLKQGIAVSEERQDREIEAELRLQLGILYQLLSQYDLAEAQLQLSLGGFRHLGSVQGEARVLNRLAYVARRKRQFARAEDLLQAAMARLSPENDQYAYALLVLGSVRFDQRRWQEAIALNEEALAIWLDLGDRRMQAWTYTNLGLAFWRSGDLEQAATHLQVALTLFDEVNDPVHRAVAAMNLGGVFIDLDQPQTALAFFLQAEQTFRITQESFRQAKIYNNIGQAYLALDRPEDAINAFKRSIRIWEQVGDYTSRKLNALISLGIAHLAAKQYQLSNDILLEARSLLPTLEDEPRIQVLAREIDEALRLADKGLTRTLKGME